MKLVLLPVLVALASGASLAPTDRADASSPTRHHAPIRRRYYNMPTPLAVCGGKCSAHTPCAAGLACTNGACSGQACCYETQQFKGGKCVETDVPCGGHCDDGQTCKAGAHCDKSIENGTCVGQVCCDERGPGYTFNRGWCAETVGCGEECGRGAVCGGGSVCSGGKCGGEKCCSWSQEWKDGRCVQNDVTVYCGGHCDAPHLKCKAGSHCDKSIENGTCVGQVCCDERGPGYTFNSGWCAETVGCGEECGRGAVCGAGAHCADGACVGQVCCDEGAVFKDGACLHPPPPPPPPAPKSDC